MLATAPGSHNHQHVAKGAHFDHAVHHPVPEVLKHTTSPLSAALFLFAVGTVAKSPSIKCWWNARRTLGFIHTIGWRRGSIPLTKSTRIEDSRRTSTASSATATRVVIQGTGPASQRSSFSTVLLNSSTNVIVPQTEPTSRFVVPRLISKSEGSSAVSSVSRPSIASFRTPKDLVNVDARRAIHRGTKRARTFLLARGLHTSAQVSPSSSGHLAAGQSSLLEVQTDKVTGHLTETIPQSFDPVLMEHLAQLYPPDIVTEVAAHMVQWPTVTMMTSLLEGLQASTGLPWWASIMVMTFALRATVLPLNIGFMRHQLKVKVLQPRLAELNEKMENAEDLGEKERYASEALALLKDKHARPLAHWWTPLLFPPYFLSWFGTVYNTALSNPELLSGGILWFNDLTSVDPTFLLPVAASLTWLGIVEMNASAHYLTSPKLKMWTRFTALALVPVLSTLPNAVFCFWIPSNLWEIARITLFNKDSVRRFFNIPLRSDLPPVKPSGW